MSGPLSGVRVVDLSINILGPMAAQTLGDMGADVIKVETPQGDKNRYSGPSRHPGMSAMFMANNRNKRSVVLDLKSAEGIEALMKLVETADVFIHTVRSSAAERLGFSYEAVSKRNPRIIYAYAAGYNQSGPKKNRPVYDDVIQAESGLVGMIRDTYGQAQYVPTAVIDKSSGQMLAGAIAMALYSREKTGEGQAVYIPMFENAVAWLMVEHLWNGVFNPPQGPLGYTRMLSAHRRPFETTDGHIALCALTDDQWQSAFKAMNRPDWAEDPRFKTLPERNRNFNELYRLVGECLRTRSTREWCEAFDAADVPNGAVNTLQGVYDDAYLKDTGFWVNYEHPTEGACVTTAVVPRFSKTPGGLQRPQPTLGQHTDEVLGEIGLKGRGR
jgi:crotonobetainyl-CoA:carnitine CoA-transferase CaiB-like acyl-CoA transferase